MEKETLLLGMLKHADKVRAELAWHDHEMKFSACLTDAKGRKIELDFQRIGGTDYAQQCKDPELAVYEIVITTVTDGVNILTIASRDGLEIGAAWLFADLDATPGKLIA